MTQCLLAYCMVCADATSNRKDGASETQNEADSKLGKLYMWWKCLCLCDKMPEVYTRLPISLNAHAH